MFTFAIFSIFLATSVKASELNKRACQPSVVIDNFTSSGEAFVYGAMRNICLLGGDYGGEGVTMDFSTVAPGDSGHLGVTASVGSNHFFFKTNAEACDDISRFVAIKIIFQAPVGSDAKFTLTQKTADCKERVEGGDSVYVSVSDFVVPNGEMQDLTMPIKTFLDRSEPDKVPNPFDLVHLKDFTFVDMKPVGAEWKIHHLELVGDCHGSHHAHNSSNGHHNHNDNHGSTSPHSDKGHNDSHDSSHNHSSNHDGHKHENDHSHNHHDHTHGDHEHKDHHHSSNKPATFEKETGNIGEKTLPPTILGLILIAFMFVV